ncbi:MAG TPA: hypothetical protein VHC22_09225 [Pirellulales bacterium]|nr:hypothetical protein [Pirellulales bacterium]
MKRSRAGFTMIECCAAVAILTATLTLVVALLTSLARQRQAVREHAQAVLAADNLMERVTSEPYDNISTERGDELGRAADLENLLPGGTAKVDVAPEAGSPSGKRVVVAVTWRRSATGPLSRHQVATIVYRAGAEP